MVNFVGQRQSLGIMLIRLLEVIPFQRDQAEIVENRGQVAQFILFTRYLRRTQKIGLRPVIISDFQVNIAEDAV